MICGYASQPRTSFFFTDDKLKGELDIHSVDDLVMCLGDFNGPIGRHIHGFDEVHGEYGVDLMNLDGRMSLEFCLDKQLCMSNKWFMRDDRWKFTF